MTHIWLVVVDTTQIQSYVFGSNKLAENIGASWLVKQMTGEWALETIQHVAKRHNIKNAADNELNTAAQIEKDHLGAEVIYAAGGNVLVLFSSYANSREFVRLLSRKALCEAPGLTLLFSMQPFEWLDQSTQLYDTVQRAFEDLDNQKRSRSHTAPLLGIGVTAVCQSTGMPANRHNGTDADFSLVSSEVAAKRNAAVASHVSLRDTFGGVTGVYDFPRDFEKLGGTKNEQSYIAVVHADGNGMGKLLQKIGTDNSKSNRGYIQAVRKFSYDVADASLKAMRRTIYLLQNAIEVKEGKHRITRVEKQLQGGRKMNASGATLTCGLTDAQVWLPFRPLVYGGDDNTFVCDGRIGVALAIHFLEFFKEEATSALKGFTKESTSACAGVAIVKSHFPFARAYELCVALCDSAKKARLENEKVYDGSYIDWHFATSGLSGSLQDIRKREYEYDGATLCLRPLSVGSPNPAIIDDQSARRWEAIEEQLKEFYGSDWSGRHNKVKDLRQTLREGPDAVERFLLMYKIRGGLPPLLPVDEGIHRKNGWIAETKNIKRCAYFDAIELADAYIPIEERVREVVAGGKS